MTKTLIRACDDAFQQFRLLSEQLMRELAEYRALIDDYDDIAERQVRAANAGVAFVCEAAVAYHEATTGRTVSEALRDRSDAWPGAMIQ